MANLNIRVTASSGGADRVLQQLKGDLGGLGDSAKRSGGMFGGLLDGLGKLGLAGLGFSAVTEGAKALGNALLGPIGGASDLGESVSKVGVVFGPAAGQIEAFGKTAAQALGQSQQQALAAAGTFGNLFVSMGLGQTEAADLSKNILTLGGDLASFNNIESTDALEKLRAGLTGEAEPLKSLGINMNAAMVEAEGLALGLAGTTKELTEADKVQARYSIIMKQTTTAQGDFARTSTGLANSQRIIAAEFANLSTEIGSRLLPVIAPLVSQFATALPAALDMVLPLFDLFGSAVQDIGGFLTTFLIPHLTDLGGVVQRVFGGDFQGAVDLLSSSILPRITEFGENILSWIGEMIPPLVAQLKVWAGEFVAWVAPMIPPLLAELAVLAGGVWAWIGEQAPVFLRTLIGEWIPAFVGWVLPMIPVLLDQMGHVLLGLGGWLVNTAAPELLRFALSLGKAIIDGILQALAPLGPQVSDAIGKATAGAGAALVENVKRGVQLAAPGLYNAVRGMAETVDALLPHSLAEEGPFSVAVNWDDVLQGNLPQTFQGIKRLVQINVEAIVEEIGEIADAGREMTREMAVVLAEQTGDWTEFLRIVRQESAITVTALEQDFGSGGRIATMTSQATADLANLLNARSNSTGLINNLVFPQQSSGGGGGSAPAAVAVLDHPSQPGFDWGKYNAENQGKPRNPDGTVARASGGPVWPWQRYTVGERGPETFVPSTPGYIVPNGGGGAGGGRDELVIRLMLGEQQVGELAWNYMKRRAAAGATMGF